LDKLFKKLFEENILPDPENKSSSPGGPVFLIAGLGNPGREFRNNRHNSGFMLVDRLAERLGTSFGKLESRALVAKGDHLGRRIILAKPQTYMNLSGQAVGGLLHYYKIPVENLLVAYDEVDLPLGVLRLRPTGGSAGQKGMKSIIQQLGTQDIARLRIGIGRPPGRMDASDYVLQDFSRDQAAVLPALLERAADAALAFATQGIEAAMNQYNGIGEAEI
jgi:PTH1 family peptidyl-tRNA hydrolase